MELFDEIIQNKQLEDTITERQVLRARKNIEKSHREGENTEVKADNLTEVPKAQRATEA